MDVRSEIVGLVGSDDGGGRGGYRGFERRWVGSGLASAGLRV